jgi:hypothetical protein
MARGSEGGSEGGSEEGSEREIVARDEWPIYRKGARRQESGRACRGIASHSLEDCVGGKVVAR